MSCDLCSSQVASQHSTIPRFAPSHSNIGGRADRLCDSIDHSHDFFFLGGSVGYKTTAARNRPSFRPSTTIDTIPHEPIPPTVLLRLPASPSILFHPTRSLHLDTESTTKSLRPTTPSILPIPIPLFTHHTPIRLLARMDPSTVPTAAAHTHERD